MTNAPKAGEVWADKDPREAGRKVRIRETVNGRVYYESLERNTGGNSDLKRFIKAFTREK